MLPVGTSQTGAVYILGQSRVFKQWRLLFVGAVVNLSPNCISRKNTVPDLGLNSQNQPVQWDCQVLKESRPGPQSQHYIAKFVYCFFRVKRGVQNSTGPTPLPLLWQGAN